MDENYYDILRTITQSTMLFIIINLLIRKDGQKYTSWRKGFFTGMFISWLYVVIGFIVLGIPLIKEVAK